jgi:hypothetical protein
MIRMAYLDDGKLRNRLKNAYLKKMNTKYLQGKWKKTISAIPELAAFNYSLEKLLVAPFGELVKIAKEFKNLLDAVGSDARRNAIKAQLKDLFKYDEYYQSHKIAPFFMEHAEEMKLHTCHYCNMAYINTFDYVDDSGGTKKKKSHFDLDHVLEKADYPILAFSLFNVIPSCPICNERMKRDKALAKSQRLLKKFSPSSGAFQFDRNVSMELMPIGGIIKRPFMKNRDAYELDFECHADKSYRKYVKIFRLKERYNYHKVEALRLKDLKMRYPATNVANIASMLGLTFDEVNEDIFGLRFVKEEHRCFEKLRRDMLK